MEVNVLLLFVPNCNPNSSPKPKCLTTGPVGGGPLLTLL